MLGNPSLERELNPNIGSRTQFSACFCQRRLAFDLQHAHRSQALSEYLRLADVITLSTNGALWAKTVVLAVDNSAAEERAATATKEVALSKCPPP